MINEERVKELTHMAIYDEHRQKECRQMGEYYMWDYVWKELLKSFFSGAMAFLLLLTLWGIHDVEECVEMIGRSNLKEMIGRVIIAYITFMAVYLIVTAVIYCVRYVYGRKRLRGYAEHLKKVRRMYRREEQMNR